MTSIEPNKSRINNCTDTNSYKSSVNSAVPPSALEKGNLNKLKGLPSLNCLKTPTACQFNNLIWQHSLAT